MPLFVAWLLSVCLVCAPQSTPDVSTAPPASQPSVAPSADGPDSAPAADVSPIRIGPLLLTGYAQVDGLFPLGGGADAAGNGTFRVRRARVYASADVLPKLGFMISADAVASPMLLDVYVAFRYLDAANIRVGQFIAPYSLERLFSTKELEAIDRVIDHFVPSRDMGVTVFNAKPFFGHLVYSAAVINGTGQNARDTNNSKDVVGRVALKVPGLEALAIGANGQSGRQAFGMRRRWGGDLNLERGAYRIAAEYLHQSEDDWLGRPGHGFYLLARRRFRPATPRADFEMAEAVFRFVDLREPGILGTAEMTRREVQAGGNYYFSHNVRVMADAGLPMRRAARSPRATIITRVQFMF